MTYAKQHDTSRTSSRSDRAPSRKVFVVHDGWAFPFSVELRKRGMDVAEGPLLSFANGYDASALAVIATRPSVTRRDRVRDWARELCWKGTPLLAVGSAVRPVAEFFSALPSGQHASASTARLVDVSGSGRALLEGLPATFRMALPAGERVDASQLGDEFRTTAASQDGELIGASHVYRPVHLLHAAAIETPEVRSRVAQNILRLLRERGGRAF
jgi:hypothetical protein